MTEALRKAAQAVLDRWDSPQWEWTKQGPTADLMNDLRKELANDGWQPIETAPKDGTVIVIRHNRGTWIHPKDQDNICSVCVFWDGRVWKQFGTDFFDACSATHWMPLPKVKP